MTNLSPEQLGSDEMRSLCDNAQDTIRQTDPVLTSVNYPDIGSHMAKLEEAESGIEHVENDLERRISELKNSLGTVNLLKKDLRRKWEQCKRKYWEIRKATPSPVQQ